MSKPTTSTGHGPGHAPRGAGRPCLFDDLAFEEDMKKAVMAAQAAQNRIDQQTGHSSTLCILGPNGTQTFDFEGLSYEEKVQAAADAVMSSGDICAVAVQTPPLSKAAANAANHVAPSREAACHTPSAPIGGSKPIFYADASSDQADAPAKQPPSPMAKPPPIEEPYLLDARKCFEQNRCPSDDRAIKVMMNMLCSFDAWCDVAKAYSTLLKVSTMNERARLHDTYPSFYQLYLNLVAFIINQRECPTVASAFKTICDFIGFKTHINPNFWGKASYDPSLVPRGLTRCGAGLISQRDLCTPGGIHNKHLKLARLSLLLNEQIAPRCPFDAAADSSNFDNHPLWSSIVNKELCCYDREGVVHLDCPGTMQLQADRVAEALLHEESCAKLDSTNLAPSKSSKRRARQKQRKTRSAVLEAIGEHEEVATMEEAAVPVAQGGLDTAQHGRAFVAECGIFNFDDTGSDEQPAEQPAEQEPTRDELGKYIQHRMKAVGTSASSVVAPPYGEAMEEKFLNLCEVESSLTSGDDAATSVATALQCVVCFQNERAVAVVPCGHRCLCEDCGKDEVIRDKKCPLCRAEVKMFMRVFD